jgi:hypothetical protein
MTAWVKRARASWEEDRSEEVSPLAWVGRAAAMWESRDDGLRGFEDAIFATSSLEGLF